MFTYWRWETLLKRNRNAAKGSSCDVFTYALFKIIWFNIYLVRGKQNVSLPWKNIYLSWKNNYMANRSFFLWRSEKELCRHGNCYGWNVCITPKFLCGSPNCQWDSIWKRGCGRELGLDKVMRVVCPWPHKKRNRNTAPLSLSCEDTARTQPPAGWEEGSQQNPDHGGTLSSNL